MRSITSGTHIDDVSGKKVYHGSVLERPMVQTIIIGVTRYKQCICELLLISQRP
jgi:hypothetical protein